ncbi:MAG: DnaB-like helicase N-terminal domain-containing protein [Tepidisphaeraceae bacterium]
MNPADLFNRVPPHDATAEAAAIGSAMIAGGSQQRELLATLKPEHFYVPQHGQIWAALLAIAKRAEPTDEVTIRAELHARGELDEVGGMAALVEVLKSTPSAAAGQHYASIVLTHARRRSLVRVGYDTAVAAMEASADPVALAYAHRDRLDAILRRATSPVHREGGAAEVAAVLDAEAAGLRRAASMPWPMLARMARPLLPGAITLLVGDPGAGKTFWLMESLNHWTLSGVPSAALALEKDRAWHNRRCLALLTKDLRLLDDESVRSQPAWYTSRPGEHAETLDAIGRQIWDSTHVGSTLDEIAAWIDQRADAGGRVIFVDPISLADTEDKPWIAHDAFMRQVRRSIERTGASLLLVTHPRGGVKASTHHRRPGRLAGVRASGRRDLVAADLAAAASGVRRRLRHHCHPRSRHNRPHHPRPEVPRGAGHRC